MPELTVTSKGQVTLRREVLRHMGIEPGQKVEFDLEPGGRVTFHPPRERNGSIEDFLGCMAGKTDVVLTLEDINRAIEDGWAGRR